MKTGKKPFVLTIATVFLILTGVPPAIAADGMVAGTIAIEMEDGHVEPGNWIRILLVTSAVEVPTMDRAMPPGDPDYVDTVNSLHTGFYIQVQNHLAEKGYLFATTLTTDEGTFKVPAVAPGDYFVVVKFPDNIRGHKVAWQVPVKIESGETAIVNLNRSNLALPTVKR